MLPFVDLLTIIILTICADESVGHIPASFSLKPAFFITQAQSVSSPWQLVVDGKLAYDPIDACQVCDIMAKGVRLYKRQFL